MEKPIERSEMNLPEGRTSYTWAEWTMAVAQGLAKNEKLINSEYTAADRISKISSEVADKMIQKQIERTQR